MGHAGDGTRVSVMQGKRPTAVLSARPYFRPRKVGLLAASELREVTESFSRHKAARPHLAGSS